MPLLQSCSIALFCMAAVFGVLLLLWGMLKLCSALVRAVEKKGKSTSELRRK